MKKINLNIVLIILLDAFFYLSAIFILVFWLIRANERMAAFNFPADVSSLGLDKAQELLGQEKNFYYLVILSFAVVLLAIILLASIIKGIIWAKTAKTKITYNLLSKFLVLNLFWMGFWFVIILITGYIVQPGAVPYFLLALTMIALYLTNNLYAIFMRSQSFKSIVQSVKLSFSRIHLFLLPYAAIFLLFYIILFVSSLIQLDYYALLAATKIYGFFGSDYSFIFSGIASEPSPDLSAVMLSSILLNPLFLIFAAAVRYYASALAEAAAKY